MADKEIELELQFIGRTMVEHQLDLVVSPSGWRVKKTVHALPSLAEGDGDRSARAQSGGILNAVEQSGRLPVDGDELMFAASRAPQIDESNFRPGGVSEDEDEGAPMIEGESDGDTE